MADLGGTDRDALLRRVLSALSRRAATPDELAEELGVPVAEIREQWRSINALRRCQGRELVPAPRATSIADAEMLDAAEVSAAPGAPDAPAAPFAPEARPCLRGWYSLTWRLGELLEQFQRNEGLAVHYETVLAQPEGGHFVLSLAATEVKRLLRFECTGFDEHRLSGVCIGAYEPRGDVETLVANVGRILLHVEDYRAAPFTLEFVEGLYADMLTGVSLDGVENSRQPGDEARVGALTALCRMLRGEPSPARQPAPGEQPSVSAGRPQTEAPAPAHHPLVAALIAWSLLVTVRPFPLANELMGYVLYFLVLHRAGYHFSAHVPLTRALGLDVDADGDATGAAPDAGLAQDAAPVPLPECGGSYDWTAFFERTVARLIDEQAFIADRLDGMARRRARIRAIVEADETMNARQQDVMVEALLHSNAEFSYAVHEQRYGVSYLCARSDLARFLDMGLFTCCDDGIRHFFIAAEGFAGKAWAYLRQRCPQAYARYYGDDGALREEFRSSGHALERFNANVGFYDPALMEGVWIEHYAHRRLSIVDEDGLRRRGGQAEPPQTPEGKGDGRPAGA